MFILFLGFWIEDIDGEILCLEVLVINNGVGKYYFVVKNVVE